jgi:hypothetical protein
MAGERRDRVSVDMLTDVRRSWLRERARAEYTNEGEIVRRCVDAAMAADRDPLAAGLGSESEPEPDENLDPQDAFLAAVRKWYVLELAAEKAGLDWDMVSKWLRGKKYLEQVQRAQWVCLAEIEHQLLRCGRVGKGNAIATEGFLKAHHPFYGRAKAEEFLRGWARLQDDLFKCLAEEFGPQQAAALERALTRFESMKEVRMAART